MDMYGFLIPQGLFNETPSAYDHRLMQDWRASRPVDVARLNSSVFRAVLRKFELLFVVMIPIEIVSVLLLAHHRDPTMGMAQVLAHSIPFLLTGSLTHFLGGLLVAMFLVALGSLAWWRHVLAIGRPSTVLAALASAVRGILRRLVRKLDGRADLLAVPARRRAGRSPRLPSVIDQLCASLCLAPSAPPLRLALAADRSVRPDQLTARRAA